MIPQKLFYTIGDVCRLTGVKAHILRYWESEFHLLKPARRYSGHRKFSQKDIDLIHRIRFLILEKKYTLAGARREIQREFGSVKNPPDEAVGPTTIPLLQEIRRELDDCLQLLDMERAEVTE